METDLTVLSLPEGDVPTRCAELRKTLAQLRPGATLYVSGPEDLPEVLHRVTSPDLAPWQVIAGPIGLEAWTRKEHLSCEARDAKEGS